MLLLLQVSMMPPLIVRVVVMMGKEPWKDRVVRLMVLLRYVQLPVPMLLLSMKLLLRLKVTMDGLLRGRILLDDLGWHRGCRR